MVLEITLTSWDGNPATMVVMILNCTPEQICVFVPLGLPIT